MTRDLSADWKDKALYTPGPLTTSRGVKEAMLRDLGSRDAPVIDTVKDIRERLVALAGGDPAEHTTIPVQGSGTFAIEAAISTLVPADGKLLVLINGAYGRRIADIARIHGIEVVHIEGEEDQPPDQLFLDAQLMGDPRITHVALVHCETTTGILNPLKEIGDIVAHHGRSFIVDAMSSFGAVPVDMTDPPIDCLISSANKCLEGVPGFAYAIVRRGALPDSDVRPRTLTLDLAAQQRGLEANGQFRFTPPTHALLAMRRALDELDAEGGIAGRQARYQRNHDVLRAGMLAMGFTEYVPLELQSPIITTWLFPRDPDWSFNIFASELSERGYVIYPGKLTRADCFRVGCIGRLGVADMRALLAAVREILAEMGVEQRGGHA